MPKIKGFKKIKFTGKDVHSRHFNKEKNIQVTVQKQYHKKGYEVSVFELNKKIGAVVHKKFLKLANAKKFAYAQMKKRGKN